MNIPSLNKFLPSKFKKSTNRSAAQQVFVETPYLGLEKSDSYIYKIDKNFSITWANDRLLEKVPDALGKKCYNIIFNSSSKCKNCQNLVDPLLKTTTEVKYADPDRNSLQLKYFESTHIPLFVAGEFSGSIKIMNQIKDLSSYNIQTDENESLIQIEKLKKTENIDFFDNLNYPSICLGSNGIVKQVNKLFQELTGWTDKELIGLPNPILSESELDSIINIHPTDPYRFVQKEILKNKGGHIEVKISKLGNITLSDSDNIILIIEEIIPDIVLSEDSILLESKYKSFINNIQGIIFRFDKNFSPLYITGAIEELTGYTKNDFLNNKVRFVDLIYQDETVNADEVLNRMRTKGRNEKSIEYRLKNKDGAIKWVHQTFLNKIDVNGNTDQIEGIIYNITERKDAEDDLKRSREQYRNLAAYIDSIREEEKKRLAIEIHDELGHALTALKLELAWVIKKKFLRQEVMLEKVRKMNELIESTIRKVRSISSQLRPSVLDHFGLVAALEWQAGEFQKRSAIRCKLTVNSNDIKLDETRSTAIFRIFQEILTNIARHAKATRVDVALEKTGNELTLRVSDNGRGIKQEQINNKKSLGLLGMLERAHSMNGKLTISGIIGIGTTVTVSIPLSNKDTL